MLLALALILQQPPLFPAIDHPGADPLLAADLRSLCPPEIATDRAALLKLEASQSERRTLGSNAAAWSALGCTRALLGASGALSHASAAMIAGDSWTQGAINALEQSLLLHPDRRAAELLAVLAMNEPEPRDFAAIALALDKAAATGPVGSAVLRACSDFGLRSGHPELTRRCSTRALHEGKDSTWHSLLLARLDFRAADTVAGSRDFVQAAGAAHDTLAKLAIDWHLQWFVSPDERKAWSAIGDSGRDAWVRNMLANRDVRDGRPEGARLAEHFKRLDHVDSAFRLSVARVLRTSMLTKPSVGMTPSALGSVANPAALQPDVGDVTTMLLNQPFRDYARWQVDIDDRGVVWMRFGQPQKIQVATDIEVWYYEIDGKPMLVTFGYEQFAGSAAPTRLRVGQIGDVYCGVDAWRCVLGSRQHLNPEVVRQVIDQDREYIATATTKDDNSIRTDKTIELISRLHRLWDPISGAPIGLLTFAVKNSDLAVAKDGDGRTARVEFDLRRWDGSTGRWQDTSFTQRFAIPDAATRQLTGFLITRSSPTVSSWSLVATQSENRRGRAWDITTGPLDAGPLALSDLVLGQVGQGLVWTSHNVEVLLAPLNAVDRHQPVSLYYQLRSTTARNDVRTTIALYRIEGGVALDTASLQVGFEQVVRAGVNEVGPTLDVSRLDKGSYQLEVRLTGAGGALISRRTVQLELN